tara:strand:- start:235 stop:651 length:417 start_codon:yes stop_codon:yes gene_type:complete
MSGDPGLKQPIKFHSRELTPSKRIVLQHAYFTIMNKDLSAEEWNNPLDSMPIATENGSMINRYADPERQAEIEAILESNPRPEEDMAEWFKDEKPLPDTVEDTMHEKMYQIATSKYNPFSVGGSESISDFQGGSERLT